MLNNTENLKFVKGGRARKIQSPFCPCGKLNDDGKFAPFENYTDKGKCFSCGEFFAPNEKDKKYVFTAETEKIEVPSYKVIDRVMSNFSSPFHHYIQHLLQRDLSAEFEEWGIGTNEQSKKTTTCFVLYNAVNEAINLKYIEYHSSGKRDKTSSPYYSKNCKRCLFGLHLYDNQKPILLVESEKSAFFVGLYLKNDFNVLATGGANSCNKEMLLPLLKNEIYYFCDNDKAGTENSILTNLKTLAQEKQIKLKILMPFKKEIKGYDIADFVVQSIENNQEKNIILQVKRWINEALYFEEEKTTISNVKKEIITSENSNQAPKKQSSTNEIEQESSAKQGKRKNNVTKIIKYISSKYDFRKNILTDKIEYKTKQNTKYQEVNTNDLMIEIWEYVCKAGENILRAILESSFVPTYNPIHDYFENLSIPSNTSKDYIYELANCVEFDRKEEKERFKIQFKKFLVRSIAQAYQQHVNKQCLVLVGNKQDTGKTTFLRFLIPPTLKHYYTENIDFVGKDDYLALNQNFIINIEELKNLKKDKVDTIKATLSMESIKLRKVYARDVNCYERYANFVATTNNDDFLKDETGSIRWLCFGEVIGVHFSYYTEKINIDYVWSQAYQLYKSGFDYQVSQDEKAESEQSNKKYSEQTDEDVFLLKYFEPDEESNERNFKTPTDIVGMIDDIFLEKEQPPKRLCSKKMGKSLNKFNFPKGNKYLKEKKYNISGYYVKFKHAKSKKI